MWRPGEGYLSLMFGPTQKVYQGKDFCVSKLAIKMVGILLINTILYWTRVVDFTLPQANLASQ